MLNLKQGSYSVKFVLDKYRTQTQVVTVNPLKETAVGFNISTFVESPGFESGLVVFAIAGIIGFQRYPRKPGI
jgi:hypothetical protein